MSFIKIPIFDGGLVTNADPEDIQNDAAISSVNFETNIPGKLVKRDGRGATTTLSGDFIGQITKWTNQDLTSPVWVYYETQTDKIKTCAANFTGASDIKTLHSDVTDIKISNFGRTLRFANDLFSKAGVYQKINRSYFFGGHTFNAIHYDDATPSLPTTWTYDPITEIGNGNRQGGYYYYMFVPVFDGVQEHPQTDGFSYYKLNNNDKTLKVPFKMSKATNDFNPRITAVNIYRSYSATATGNIDPVYYLIRTIPISTKSTHEDAMGSETAEVLDNVAYSDKFPSSAPTDWGGNTTFYLDGNELNDGVAWNGKTVTLKAGDTFGSSVKWDQSFTFTKQAQGENSQSNILNESSGGYYGKTILYKDSWSWYSGEANGRVAFDDSPSIEEIVVDSKDRVVKLSNPLTQTGSVTVALSDGYRYEINSNDVTLYFYDYDYLDGGLHPLNKKTKITVNHKYSAFISGRQFVGNVRLDPDGDAEDHEDWIIYSEMGQPDVLPIVNYIQIKDIQGGAITGLANQLGSLVVFMERGIYRLDIPSTNPGDFSLIESEDNFGCIAPNSIVTVGSQTFFAGADNAYVMDSGFNISPITEPIKNVYQAKTNLKNSKFFYDPKKARLLCRFGDDKQNIYSFDIQAAKGGKAIWYQLDMGSSDVLDIFAIDENLDVYTITNS